MSDQIPKQPPNSFRVILELNSRVSRMDNTLLEALKKQNDDSEMKTISRSALKELFTTGKVQIKGQRAKPSSALAVGTTYVDILKS
ncbi:MAG: hypothetical protein H7061_08420 [Bdellovibrionaceae bacterium]|nr:hypothetical protein [Bdellovibrio sp.]